MEHPPDKVMVVRFKRWLNAVFEAWIEKRPLYVIVVSFFYRRAISLRFVPPPLPPPRELTFRDHLRTHVSMPVSCHRFVRPSGFEPLSYFLPGSINKIWLRWIGYPVSAKRIYIYVSISDKASVHSCSASLLMPWNNVAAIRYFYHVRFISKMENRGDFSGGKKIKKSYDKRAKGRGGG